MGTIADSTDATLALLTGPDVDDLLAAALAPAGARVLRWSLRDIDHRPGRRTTVTYTADTSWPDGVRTETLGASVDPRAGSTPAASDGRLTVSDGEHTIEVWRFPYDPELPALADATIPAAAEPALRALGLSVADVRLSVVAYRPRKRAVIEVTTPTGRIFVKVLRPAALDAVRSRHDLLTAAGVPVAPVLAAREDGLLVLGELVGTPLRTAIAGSGARSLDPRDLVSVLDRLPDAVARLPRRRPWSAHARHYAGVVASALPDVAAWTGDLADGVESGLAGYDDADEPTHGDFYEAQVVVDGGRITGLLDVDTIGPGRRADDLACLLGHLSVLAVMTPPDAGRLEDALTEWQRAMESYVDARELRTRAAGVVLSLATGPFRARDPQWETATTDRLALVGRWLESASHPAGPTSLRDLSSASPSTLIRPRKS